MSLIRRMSPVEGVLLSLGCRSLWAQVTLQSTDVLRKLNCCLPLDQTMHFLRMLEKDGSRHVICTACLRLHRWKIESRFVQLGAISFHVRPCSSELGEILMNMQAGTELHIQRDAVELVLRAASSGPGHGLPLDVLRTSASWEVFGATLFKMHFWSDGLVWRNKDHDDRLLLKTEYNIEVDLRRPLNDQVMASRVGSCQHDAYGQQRFVVTSINKFETDQQSDQSRALRCCPHCPTDMLVQVSKIPGEVFVTIDVSAIRDVGSRGDHRARTWQAQSYDAGRSSCNVGREHFDRSAPYPFGQRSLHIVWEEAEELARITEKMTEL